MIRPIAIVTITWSVFITSTLIAQEPLRVDALDQNAALSYWQAFAVLPSIDDEKRETMRSIMRGDSSIDDDMRELVGASKDSLNFLYRGTSIESCSWGAAFENGPYTLLPHLGKARELSRIALLRARIRFDEGQVDQGMDDAIVAIKLGRHAGHDSTVVLINTLVGIAIESEAIETIANHLHQLDSKQRSTFAKRISEAQRSVEMNSAMKGERDVFLGWLVREIEDGRSGNEMVELASDLEAKMITPEVVDRLKQASSNQLLEWAKSMNTYYDTALAAMLLNSDEAIANVEALVEEVCDPKNGNPLGRLFLPAIGQARNAANRLITKRAQLNAAFAVFDDGPAALKRKELRDPVGDEPFQLKRLDDGAELISDGKHGDTPITLQIPGLPK